LTKQIRGFNQAIRNANDAISMAQVAEGSLAEVANMVQRIRELAVQSANGNYTDTERSSLNAESIELRAEISRLSNAVTFNGVSVVGSDDALKFQIGQGTASATNMVTMSFIDIAGANGVSQFLASAVINADSFATITIGLADTALDKINQIRADLGAKQNRFESTVRNLQNVVENLSASRSRVEDADFAVETASLTRAQILQQAGTAMLAQANSIPQSVLSLLQ
jgi:flagellin